MKKFLQSDYFLMLLSIFVAIVLWAFVVYEQNPVEETWLKNIPITYANKSESFENGKLIITEGDNRSVDLKIKGSRNVLATIKDGDISCVVNMEDVVSSGSYSLPINVNIRVYGVELVSKNIHSVELNVDSVVTGEREVKVSKIGNPKAGFLVGDIQISPSTVRLSGPKSVIDNISEARVSVEVTDASKDIEGLYKIKLYDGQGKEIVSTSVGKNVEYCDVLCKVLATKDVKVIPFLKSETNSIGQAINVVSVEPSKVTFVGTTEDLNALGDIYTKPIDVFGITQKETVSVALNTDELNENVYIKDNISSVTIELSPESDNSDGEATQDGTNDNNTQ